MDVFTDKFRIFSDLLLDEIQNRGFDTAEGIIVILHLRFTELKRGWVTFFRHPVYNGSCRIIQAKNLSDLIKCFPGGVVRGFTNYLHVKIILYQHYRGMSTTYCQA